MSLFAIKQPFTEIQLKAEYRKLCKRYHPDTGGSAEQFKALNSEYEALKKQIGQPEPKRSKFRFEYDYDDIEWQYHQSMAQAIESVQIRFRSTDTTVEIKLPRRMFQRGFTVDLLCKDIASLSQTFLVTPIKTSPYLFKKVININGSGSKQIVLTFSEE